MSPISYAGMTSKASMEEDGEVFHAAPQKRRLLVIGKTGNGKSSVGNIILGSRHFEVGCSMTSTTVKPASGVATFDGMKVKVCVAQSFCKC